VDTPKIVVVGAGPAGIMAAIRAAALNAQVTLLEKNKSPAQKLLLSGKGRANLTNACDLDAFYARFSKNGEFLRDAFKKFSNQDLMQFFQSRGLPLKVERQLRVFPETNRSASVLGVLKKELEKNKVNLSFSSQVKDILLRGNDIKGALLFNNQVVPADKIILATGGVTYPFTGSSGEGIELAGRLGHKIVPLRPGLVPLEVRQNYPRLLEGLTLKNIRLKFTPLETMGRHRKDMVSLAGFSDGKKEIVSEVGELLFTKSGVSGPLVLTLSGAIVDWLQKNKSICLKIDLKPALSPEQLNARLLREFRLNAKKNVKNTLKTLLPLRMIDLFISLSGIAPGKKCNQVTAGERQKLLELLKGLRLDIIGARSIAEAMVTRGGVSLKDINPRTMESCLIKGLYFCGEMIDIDADTGGFNLQAAFSTGYLAGESAALSN